MISGRASRELPAAISFELVNDVEPGEVEKFVLELTGAQLTRGDGIALEVLIANSVTVDILDNDSRCCNLLLFALNKLCFSYCQFQ